MVHLPRRARIECRGSSAGAQCAFIAQLYDLLRLDSSPPVWECQATRPIASRGHVLAPDAASDVCNETQLGPLFFFGEQISFHGGGEAALRAEREIFQREKAGGLLNSASDVVRIFQLRLFRADQAEDHGLIARNQAQRLERSGTIV